MPMKNAGRSYMIIAVLLFTSVRGNGEQGSGSVPPATTPTSSTATPQASGSNPVLVGYDTPAAKMVSRTFEYVENNKYFKRYFGTLEKLDIPTDLTGKTDKEIMSYAAQLRRQRRILKMRMSLTMTITTISLLSLHFTNRYLLPVIGVIQSQNSNFGLTLDTDWMVFQQQLSAFLWEYIRVKNIDLDTLRHSFLIDCHRVKMEYKPGRYTAFPLWTTSKDERLPVTANIRSNLSMLKHWYLSK